MKRSTDLQITTASDVVGLLMSDIDGAGAAVSELTGLSDPLEVAYVVALVMDGLKRPYARDIVAELRERVDDRTTERRLYTMDPRVRRLRDAWMAGDRDEWREARQDFNEWRAAGGCAPTATFKSGGESAHVLAARAFGIVRVTDPADPDGVAADTYIANLNLG